jgi:hypothetical protein
MIGRVGARGCGKVGARTAIAAMRDPTESPLGLGAVGEWESGEGSFFPVQPIANQIAC